MKRKTQVRYKSNRLVLSAILVIGLAIGLAAGYGLWHDDSTFEEAVVSEVIDGDTVILANGQRVRYLGIDTPESGDFYFEEATSKNLELVMNKVVQLQEGNRNADEYGRLLRYVYVDGVFVNAELVAQGYAKAYIFDADEPYSQILVQLEQYAKIRNKGLWSR
ncbi:thermonuclease family protein [Bacteroidota bacterium]